MKLSERLINWKNSFFEPVEPEKMPEGYKNCEECGGQGVYMIEKCEVCNGKGIVRMTYKDYVASLPPQE